jgi:hypothetical protein
VSDESGLGVVDRGGTKGGARKESANSGLVVEVVVRGSENVDAEVLGVVFDAEGAWEGWDGGGDGGSDDGVGDDDGGSGDGGAGDGSVCEGDVRGAGAGAVGEGDRADSDSAGAELRPSLGNRRCACAGTMPFLERSLRKGSGCWSGRG